MFPVSTYARETNSTTGHEEEGEATLRFLPETKIKVSQAERDVREGGRREATGKDLQPLPSVSAKRLNRPVNAGGGRGGGEAREGGKKELLSLLPPTGSQGG